MYYNLCSFSPSIFCIICDLGALGTSCMEDPSFRFIANIWLVHNQFMGLDNSL